MGVEQPLAFDNMQVSSYTVTVSVAGLPAVTACVYGGDCRRCTNPDSLPALGTFALY